MVAAPGPQACPSRGAWSRGEAGGSKNRKLGRTRITLAPGKYTRKDSRLKKLACLQHLLNSLSQLRTQEEGRPDAGQGKDQS